MSASASTSAQLQVVDGVALTEIFKGLTSTSEEERSKYAEELHNYLSSIARDLSSEQFNRYNNDINKTIFDLLHGEKTSEILGGIAALNALIEFDSGVGKENAGKTARFSNYLGSLILSNDLVIMKQAIRTLGKLATLGGNLTGDFVDFEAKRAIEWLQSDSKQHENRRHAAILIITSLADNASTLLYPLINQVLENLWTPLRDHKLIVREDAAIALEKCMHIIYDRDVNARSFWIKRMIELASKLLNENDAADGADSNSSYNITFSGQSTENIHGSLLTYRELLKYYKDPFIVSRFEQIYENTYLYKNHKVAIIRQELTNIFPLLCKVNTELFVEKYLHRTLYYYLSQLKKYKSQNNETANTDKSAIFKLSLIHI